MRHITSQEIMTISGGYSNTVVVGVLSGTGTLLTIDVPASATTYTVTNVCTYYDVNTPMYDSWGYYVGTVTDSYVTCLY